MNHTSIKAKDESVFVGDTGRARGEPNCWFVNLYGETVYERIGGKVAEEACEKMAEKLRAAIGLKERQVATRLQSLEAENARLRDALKVIAELGYADGLNCKVIARNALKED